MILRKDALANLFSEFEQYVRSRTHVPGTREELADCGRAYFGSSRGAIERQELAPTLGFDIPKEIDERDQAWTAAALQRLRHSAANALWSLGFDEVPFPGNAKLADEFLETWKEARLPREQHVYRSAPTASPELAEVFQNLQFRSRGSNVRWTEEEYRQIVEDGAFEQLESTLGDLETHTGCSRKAAIRWLLAGVLPLGSAFNVHAKKSFNGPDCVELRINPEVATPEDVRAAYRRAIRALGFPSRGQRVAHFDTSDWTWGRIDEPTLEDLYELWNDVHPLWRFKNVESFRVSRYNAYKRYRPDDTVRPLKRRAHL